MSRRKKPLPIIIDTDMSIDVDDVGALCIAHVLSDLHETRLLAVVHDAAVETGVAAIASINSYFGRADIPIGAYRGPVGTVQSELDRTAASWPARARGVYVDKLAAKFPTAIKSAADVPDAVTVYRTALRSAARGSVTIVSIGFATVLQQLLQSAEDRALVEAKVGRLIMMGGRRLTDPYWNKVEWNFGASQPDRRGRVCVCTCAWCAYVHVCVGCACVRAERVCAHVCAAWS